MTICLCTDYKLCPLHHSCQIYSIYIFLYRDSLYVAIPLFICCYIHTYIHTLCGHLFHKLLPQSYKAKFGLKELQWTPWKTFRMN